MKVITKDWGTQIWLNDYELLMVMRADTQTSMHRHIHHSTRLVVLQGSVSVLLNSMDAVPYRLSKSAVLMCDEWHCVRADTACIIHETYTPIDPRPAEDIERLS